MPIPRELPVIRAYFPSDDIRTSFGHTGESARPVHCSAKGAPSLADPLGWSRNSTDPADDARDAVDGDRGPFGDPPGRTTGAEHRRNGALPRQRRQVRGAAAELGHDARRAGKHRGERRARDLCDDDAPRDHTLEVALVQDQTRRARAPANARRLTGQRRVATPSVVRSEERRVGKECRSRWARAYLKKKKTSDWRRRVA